jgi:sugar phosphate isomerase/epimerase
LCYDTSHDNLYGDPTFELLLKLSKRIFLTHISDNSGKKDDHFLPWKGTFNWKKFADIFSNIKYDGILTLEVFPDKKYNKPDDFLNLAFKTSKKLYRMSKLG